MPEADSKIFLQKRPVSERNLKKNLLKQPFFCKSVHESADVQFQIKTNKKRIQHRLKVSCEQSKGLFRTDKDCSVQSAILTFDRTVIFPISKLCN